MAAGATGILSIALKKIGFGKSTMYVGLASVVFDCINAYSWLISPTLTFISEALFSSWFIVVGVKIIAVSRQNLDLQT